MGCRYPCGIKTPPQLYDFLKNGRSAIGSFGLKQRFAAHENDGTQPRTTGAFLDDIDLFDPLFFGISPKEAREIDPQHRLAMFAIWEALEDAGIAVDSLRGKAVGVFIASASDDYQHLALTGARADLVNVYTSLGTSRSSAAGRIAYLLGFTGPALQVDTSCSSSLVAVHLACQSLAAAECEVAIVAGVNLILDQKNIQLRIQLNALSNQGRCRPFDERADGFVQGEGIGAVVLKPAHQARQDRNPVYCEILASACNHNGGGNGLTAPNGKAQEALLREALKKSGVLPQDVFYIEAHGTGTKLGDPIEIQSINNVYNVGDLERIPLYVGSSKANFGHLEAGAGLLSLIKTAMMMENGEIPPQIHVQQLNSLIDWQRGRATVATESCPWPADAQGRRIAGISSFGITGTNVHLIVAKRVNEQQPDSDAAGRESWPLLLSAKQPESLTLLRQQLTDFASNTQAALVDASHTLAMGRRHFEHRVAVAANGWSDVATALSVPPTPSDNEKGWVFACTGQGAQYLGMGQEWYRRFPVFRAVIDELDASYMKQRGSSLKHILWQQQDEEKLNDTGVAQPALFAFEYATYKLLQSFGIEPAAVIGHSVGEYVAACIAGVFSVSQAFNLVLLRAQLMSALPRNGSMMSVRASQEQLREMLADFAELEICVLNSPELTVVGGPHQQMATLQLRLEQQGIAAFPLTVSNAFHTVAMEPAMAALTELASQIDMQMPTLPLVSNLTGRATSRDEMSGDYWARHMRQAVRFYPCVKYLYQQGFTHFIEIGPRPVLSQLIRISIPQSCTVTCCAPGHEQVSLVEALCKIFAAGGDIRWSALFPASSGRRVDLPRYPFQLTRCWLESADTSLSRRKSEKMKRYPEIVQSDVETILVELRSIFSDLLHIPSVSMNTQRSLLESGVDSFVIVMAVNRIKERYGIKVTVRDIFERYTSISKLAQHLHLHGVSAAEVAASVPVAVPQPAVIETLPSAGHYAQSYTAGPAAVMPAPAPAATHGAGYVPPVFALDEPAPVAALQSVAQVAESSTLTPTQECYLSGFIQRYNAKTARSKQQAATNRPFLCNNRKSSSGFRQETKELTYSIQSHASSGSHITDIDGNEYVDLAMGFGALLFGHRPDFVVQRLRQQLEQGYQIGPESHLAGECARMIAQTTGMDRVLFSNTGTEAVMTALRIARAASERSKVVMFQNAYHGHFDGTMAVPDHEGGTGVSRPMSLGTPQSMVDDVIVLPFNSSQATDYLRRHAQQIAAVVTEPVQSRDPGLHPLQFLQEVRQITQDNGIILIFDEVVVGYRIALGGAQQWFGIEADMATYGKAIGGGLPIGVIAGKRAIMDKVDGGQWQFNDTSAPSQQTAYTAGTFCKHPLAIVACHAVLTRIIEEGPALQERLNQRTDEMVRILNEVFVVHQVPLQVINFGSFFRFAQNGNLSFVYQPLELDIFFFHLVEKNIYVWEGKTCFLSTAHTNADIQQIINAVNDSVVEMKAAGFWADDLLPGGQGHSGYTPAQLDGVALLKKSEPASVLSRAMSQSHDKSAPQAEKTRRCQYPDSIADGSFLAAGSADADIDFGVSTAVMEASFDNIARLENRFRKVTSAELNYTSLAPIVIGESKLIHREAASTAPVSAAEDRLPLTDDQRMLWFIGRCNPGGMIAFAQTSVMKLTGPLKVDALQRAYQAVVARHDALRTRIEQDGQYQTVLGKVQANLDCVDLTRLDAGQHDDQIRELLTAESQKQFLFDALLHRLTLVALDDRQHLLLLTTHHLICDGVSIGVLLTELAAAYDAFCQQQIPSFAPVLQFSDYVHWRNKQYLETDFQREESYWLEQCADLERESLSLPTDYARPVVKTYNGDRYVMALDKACFEQLKTFARESQMTWFMVLLGTFYCLLYRLARQQQIVVGVPFSGRMLNNSEAMVGYLSNIYPISMEMRAEESVTDYLQRLRLTLLDAYEHQNYPFSSLVEKVRYRPDASSSPLFNVAFNWDRVNFPPMNGIDVSAHQWKPRYVEFDLMINMLEVNDEAELSWDFNTDLFDIATIQHLSKQFVCLLRQFISGGRQSYSRMPLEERAAQLAQRVTLPAVDEFVSISQRLSECAIRWPERPAVSDGQRSLNWQQLDQYATKLANRLLERGVGKGDTVALCLPSSVALLVAIHAVIRIGAVYVPLNTRYPAERLREIADNAGASTIIRAEELYGDIFPDTLKTVLVLDAALTILNKAPKKVCAVTVTPQDGVYLIHTSGSSGTPKGVKTTHSNLISFCHAALERLQMSGAERFLNVSPAAFDMSVPDFFLPLFNGGQVILASEEDRLLPEKLVGLLEQHNVDFMQATPTTWLAVIESGWRGKANLKACAGGEMLTRALAKALSQRAASVWNGYGPTETTVWSNLLLVTESHLRYAVIPVGQPLANAVVYVLDDHLQPVADGHTGEIYIGGEGVAGGYLNQPSLSAVSFITNPWGKGQLYKTGDLGRWSSRGGVAVLGRYDTQVKIRGFRIETGEIEAALAELDDVAAAVVRVDQYNNATVLTGFVELAGNATVSGSALRSRLKAVLPDYMVPTVIQVMAALPRSGNDKVDRKQLPVVDFQREQAEYIAPADEVEAALCTILQSVLNMEKISCEADFFEAGGSSLDLVRLQQTIQAQFGVEIQLTCLFTRTTAREMAALVHDPDARSLSAVVQRDQPAQAAAGPAVLPVTPTLHYHLSHLGYRHHLNLIKLFDVQQVDLAPARLRDAISRLVQQHEALTLSVWQNDRQEWVQEVGGSQPELEILDLSVVPAEQFAAEVEVRLSQMQSRFSLRRAEPLARFVWIAPPQGESARLMIALHFALTDAYGMELLADQLMTLLEGQELPPAGSRYRDWFGAYQRFAREQALADLSFWLGLPWYRAGVLRQERREPVCELGRFYHREDYMHLMRGQSGQQQASVQQLAELEASQTLHTFSLGEARSARLKAALASAGIEQVDALLAAYYQLLLPLLSGRFLPVDFMFANRKPLLRNINISETVMRAAENIVLPLDMDEGDLVAQAREVQRIRTGLPHYGVGLPALRILNPDPAVRSQVNALPLPQVGFNYLSLWSLAMASSDRSLTPSVLQVGQNMGNQIDVERGIWLQLYIDESASGLEFTFSYDAHRFTHIEVTALAKKFIEKLDTFCFAAESQLSALP